VNVGGVCGAAVALLASHGRLRSSGILANRPHDMATFPILPSVIMPSNQEAPSICGPVNAPRLRSTEQFREAIGGPAFFPVVDTVTNKVYVANGSNLTVIDGMTNATANITVSADVGVPAVNSVTNRRVLSCAEYRVAVERAVGAAMGERFLAVANAYHPAQQERLHETCPIKSGSRSGARRVKKAA